MKRFAIWVSLVVLVLSLIGCGAQSPSTANVPPVENPYLDCEYINFASTEKSQETPNFSVLDELTTDIVSGYLLDDRRQDLQYIDGTKFVIFGCNISTLKITRVHKGSLKAGDEVPLAEKYYFDEEDSSKIYINEGYQPSVPGQEYIFFISASKEGMFAGIYAPNDYNLGRYPAVSSSEKRNIDETRLSDMYNVKLYGKEEKYDEFFTAAVKKYGK